MSSIEIPTSTPAPSRAGWFFAGVLSTAAVFAAVAYGPQLANASASKVDVEMPKVIIEAQ